MTPRKPTGSEADETLARINQLDESELIDDPELKALLAPFRGHDPLRMRCPKGGCKRTIVWCALHPVDANVVFSKNGPRKGAVNKMNRHGQRHWLRKQPPAPYDIWSLGPSAGRDSARPATQGPGLQHRWTFKCPKCSSTYTLKSSVLLGKLIDSLTGNRDEFTP